MSRHGFELRASGAGFGVREGLQRIHSSIQTGAETVWVDAIIAGRDVTAIGKMLGLQRPR